MTDLNLRRATAADERVLAALATRLSAFELPSWRAPRHISDADARAMIAAVAAGDPDDEVLIAERDGGVVGCLHVLAVTDQRPSSKSHRPRHAQIPISNGNSQPLAWKLGVGNALVVGIWSLEVNLNPRPETPRASSSPRADTRSIRLRTGCPCTAGRPCPSCW
jgi:hypothetical protein